MQQASFPPENMTAWDVQRVYIVPKNLIKWNAPNTIAVRVADWGGSGGMHGGEYSMEAVTWKSKFKILIENDTQNETFDTEQSILIKTQLANTSTEKVEGVLTCEIKTYTGQTVATLSQEVKVSRGRVTKVENFTFEPQKAGFYIAYFTFKDGNGYSVKEKNGFAVAPETLKSDPTIPPDFDAFWSKARFELSEIEPNFKLTPTPQWSTKDIDVYELEMRSIGNIRVRGYYAQPKNKANLPAILHVQGYSSIMEPFGLDTNVAAVYLNIRGHGNSRDDLNPGFPGFLLRGLEHQDEYIYRGAFMDCVRAVDFLYSRAEVDTSRIAVSGGSQGGALSIATASLDSRIKLCMPDIPFLSDFPQYFKIAHWPFQEFKNYVGHKGRTWDEIYAVLNYFDIKNHTPNITCPVIMGVGLFDDICPPYINFAAYNNLSSTEKEYHLYPQNGHSTPAAHHDLKMRWMYKRFGLLP